jgi:predicted Zn finger-like uncharacterized protein
MLIECPFCHARAQISDSKEGSKVRCGECGRVYGARPVGRASGSSGTNPTPFIIGGLIVVFGAVLFAMINKNKPSPVTKPPPATQETKIADTTGWLAPAVQAATKLHTAAAAGNRTTLLARIDGQTVWEARKGDEDPGWTELEGFERSAKLEGFVDELVDTETQDSIANWKPFDGHIVQEESNTITLRLDCTPTAGGPESRIFEWRMTEDGDRFKALAWGRYIDPKELAKAAKKKSKGYEKKTLSDGSVVLERQPEPLAHLEDTPQELRDEIDELYTKIIDLSLTKEMSAAMMRLQAIGKPAVPRLLTGLYETPLEDFDDARKVQNIVIVLRKITAQRFGYEPLTLVGSQMGTTEERRQSSIKQWFAWWYRKGKKFEVAEKHDALEDIIELTPEEKAWLERHKND